MAAPDLTENLNGDYSCVRLVIKKTASTVFSGAEAERAQLYPKPFEFLA